MANVWGGRCCDCVGCGGAGGRHGRESDGRNDKSDKDGGIPDVAAKMAAWGWGAVIAMRNTPEASCVPIIGVLSSSGVVLGHFTPNSSPRFWLSGLGDAAHLRDFVMNLMGSWVT